MGRHASSAQRDSAGSNVILHDGAPDALAGERLLTHARKHEGLCFARGHDIAEFWLKRQARRPPAA
jgi:hypothetical protein